MICINIKSSTYIFIVSVKLLKSSDMGKIIQLLLLLSCITTLIYSFPHSSENSNESRSSSEESKEYPNTPHVLIGKSRRDTVHTNGHQGSPDESPYPKVIQPQQAHNNGNQNPNALNRSRRDTVQTNGHQGSPNESPYPKVIQPQAHNNGNQNPNSPNRSRRDTVQSNGHQGSPDESPYSRLIQPQQTPNNGNQNSNTPNRNRRDTVHTNGQQGSPDESPHPKVIQPQQVLENGNQNRITPNRSRRDTVQTNGHQGSPNESPYPRVIQPQQAPNNANQNRPIRDTDDQQTPAKIFDSNPTSSTSTEQPGRYSSLDRNTQSASTDQSRYNRQVREYDQQTPRRVLSSNPNSPSSTEQTYTNLKSETTNAGGNQNRQVRGADDLQVPRLLLSTPSTTSQNTDSEGTKPTVSSTQLPGDVYGENLKKTEESVEKRDTHSQDNIPRVLASNSNDKNSQKPDDQKVPVNPKNFENKNRNLRETSSEKSKSTEDPDQVRIVKLDGNPYAQFQQ